MLYKVQPAVDLWTLCKFTDCTSVWATLDRLVILLLFIVDYRVKTADIGPHVTNHMCADKYAVVMIDTGQLNHL